MGERVGESLPQILTVDECAALTRYSRSTIYTMVCRGRIPILPKRTLKGKLLFDRDQVMAWLHSKKAPEVVSSPSKFEEVRSRLRGSLKTENIISFPTPSTKGVG